MTFLIGKDREYTQSTFVGMCDPSQEEPTETDQAMSTKHWVNGTDSPKWNELTIEHQFNMSLIALSTAYDNNTDTIKFCQQVKLMLYQVNATDHAIATHWTDVAVAFNLTSNFTVDANLDKAVVKKVNDTANLDSFISAFHCDKEMNALEVGAKIKPNDDLDICVQSSSSDVEIDEILSMVSRIHLVFCFPCSSSRIPLTTVSSPCSRQSKGRNPMRQTIRWLSLRTEIFLSPRLHTTLMRMLPVLP